MNIQKYDFTTVMEEQKLKDICQKMKLEKCDWDYISSYQVLSESFIREFADKVNWYYISSNQKLSESFIREFSDKLDWHYISIYQKLSEELIREFADKVDWICISINPRLSELFIREFADKVDWSCISIYQVLSESFICGFADKVDWFRISIYQKLSEGFIRKFVDKVHWDQISVYHELSEEFIREFADRVDWQRISIYQRLSEGFIREFADRVDWLQISKYQELSDEFIKEYYCNLYLDELYDSWHRKSTDEKKLKVVETNLYECHEDYFIAYKGLRNNRYSKFNLQYQYLPGETYETFADFSKEESSFGFFVGTKECAEEFIELVTENRGKDVYDQYDTFYDVFFTKKELMNDTVDFEDFLIGMGFKENYAEYESPDGSYFVQKVTENVYDIIEKDGNTKRLSIQSRLKKNLLEIHKTLTGQYLGVENPNIVIMEKLSAMFVHGDIYDFLTKKEESLKMKPEDIRISRYFLQQLGFSYTDEDMYEKDKITVHLDYKTQIKKDKATIEVYNCKEFIQAYEELTGIKCNISQMENMDNEDFRYEDMLIQYQDTIKLYEKMAEHISILDEHWKKSLIGLYLFRDWKYFFPIYEKLLLGRSIKREYTDYVRFCSNSYSVNTMFTPTFQGEQCGNLKKERDLLKTALNIVQQKIDYWYD